MQLNDYCHTSLKVSTYCSKADTCSSFPMMTSFK